MTNLILHIQERTWQKALELDRQGLPLAKQALDERIRSLIRSHPFAKELHAFTHMMRSELMALAGQYPTQKPHIRSLERLMLEPMVERFLNHLYPDVTTTSFKITLVVQDLGGFGDLVFGVRALKTLQEKWPSAHIRMLTNGADKLEKILTSVPCPVISYNPTRENYREAHALLRDSDLILVNPTGASRSLLPEDTESRAVTIIEYNRPDYGLDVRQNHFMTGIGRNTLGICQDLEMRAFAQTHFPLKRKQKLKLLEQLENRTLHGLLQALGATNRTYYGYGNRNMDRFLEVVVRHEARLDDRDAVILAITNTSYQDALKRNLKGELPPGIQRIVLHDFARDLDVFNALQEQGIDPDPETLARSREEMIQTISQLDQRFAVNHCQKRLLELDKLIEKTQQNPSPKARSEFQQSLMSGFFFIGDQAIKSTIFAESASPGKTLHIINLHGGLSFHDAHLMQEATEEICLATGDQSLTEAISLGRLLMYDLRKSEPIFALWQLATHNQLHLASEYFRSFVENRIEATVACLGNKPKLRQEVDRLYTLISREMDFAPELIALVQRKMCQGQTEREKQIHSHFRNYFLSPRAEDLFHILRLVDQIKQETTCFSLPLSDKSR